jgi:hypothetical protein
LVCAILAVHRHQPTFDLLFPKKKIIHPPMSSLPTCELRATSTITAVYLVVFFGNLFNLLSISAPFRLSSVNHVRLDVILPTTFSGPVIAGTVLLSYPKGLGRDVLLLKNRTCLLSEVDGSPQSRLFLDLNLK